jgi:hypothetical protein
MISFLKWLFLKKAFNIVLNIHESVSSLEFGTLSNAKCRVNLTVKGDLPPPGGPHAQIKIVLSTSFQLNVFLSYTPL